MSKKGRLIVISGPSGVGKTTLLKKLLTKYKDHICFSISHTSRKKRKGEVDGKDYIFVSKSEFQDGIDKDVFLEYAVVHDNYYGTSSKQIEEVTDSGVDCLLDIDVQGGVCLMEKEIKALYIFIAPPSIDVLKERLLKRSSETDKQMATRLSNAEKELAEIDRYDHVVVNEDLEQAFSDLEKIYLESR